jgi:hypothetical protein
MPDVRPEKPSVVSTKGFSGNGGEDVTYWLMPVHAFKV